MKEQETAGKEINVNDKINHNSLSKKNETQIHASDCEVVSLTDL